MKVVQINAVYEYSSTGRTSKEMHQFLKENGQESFVFCNNINDKQNNVYKLGSTIEYKFHRLLGCITGLQGFLSFFRTKLLVQRLKVINPDIVVLRNLHSNSTQLYMILKYLIKYEVPTVIVLHDCWMFTGGCVHYTKEGCYKWKTCCGKCKLIKGKKGSWFFDTSTWTYNIKKRYLTKLKRLAIIGVSDWVANESRQSFLKNSYVIKRIYNWIDIDVFKPRDTRELRKKLGIGGNDFVILGVAQNWSEAKGLSYFYKVAEKYPDIKIVMVGGLNKKHPSNMIAIGTLSDTNQLAEYYSMADVFLNFTQQETFGKVTAEALAAGTPIIVNNNTASPELVGDCGAVIPNNDLVSCYMAIEKIRDKGKREYTMQCRERAVCLFDKSKGLQEYMDLFNLIKK